MEPCLLYNCPLLPPVCFKSSAPSTIQFERDHLYVCVFVALNPLSKYMSRFHGKTLEIPKHPVTEGQKNTPEKR